jgi:magnesium chelatase subunit D
MCNTLVVFVVDASDSMGSGERLAAAKGAALALLETAYQKRDRVALVAFEGESAEVLLPPTTSTDLAREHLRQLPTGGATPFADGLLKAWQLVRTARLKDPEVEPVLVILSDGEANIPLAPGQSVLPELLDLAGKIRQDRIGAVAIDSTKGSRRSPEMLRLAEALGADYHRIDRLKAKNVVEVVRSIGGEV